MSRRKLTSKEERIWLKVTKNVSPIAQEPKRRELDIEDFVTPQAQPDAHPISRPRANLEQLKKLETPSSMRLAPKLPKPQKPHGLADRIGEKRVRRGRVDIGSTLDLHGHTQVSGRAALLSFVNHHHNNSERSVLVITGKGQNGQGILKRRLLEWIDEPDFRIKVSGFARANQKHGGEGAFYLFLRKRD